MVHFRTRGEHCCVLYLVGSVWSRIVMVCLLRVSGGGGCRPRTPPLPSSHNPTHQKKKRFAEVNLFRIRKGWISSEEFVAQNTSFSNVWHTLWCSESSLIPPIYFVSTCFPFLTLHVTASILILFAALISFLFLAIVIIDFLLLALTAQVLERRWSLAPNKKFALCIIPLPDCDLSSIWVVCFWGTNIDNSFLLPLMLLLTRILEDVNISSSPKNSSC